MKIETGALIGRSLPSDEIRLTFECHYSKQQKLRMVNFKITEGFMPKIMQGEVQHSTKVTHLKGIGWGCRVYTNGELSQGCVVQERNLIGPAIRSMLRMEDKCGNISSMAHNSRMRPGMKQLNKF